MKKKHPIRWFTPEEDRRLLELAELYPRERMGWRAPSDYNGEGRGAYRIATLMGRTVASVRSRLRILKRPEAPNYYEISGQRFSRLLVLSRSRRHAKGGAVYYLCRCDCGNEPLIVSSALRSGNTTSCGCFKLERIKLNPSPRNDRGLFTVF